MLTVLQRDQLESGLLLKTNVFVRDPEQKAVRVVPQSDARVPDDSRPRIAVGVRTYLCDDGTVHLLLPPMPPAMSAASGSVHVRWIHRELVIEGDVEIFWNFARLADGSRSAAAIVMAFASESVTSVRGLMEALLAADALDISGRPYGRFIHNLLKKPTLPPGPLRGDALEDHVLGASYREYPEAESIALSSEPPAELRPLHALLRKRRSFARYNGNPIERRELEGLLSTACGVTAQLARGDRSLNLRAYPSPGGLYSVEIYPIILNVNEIEPSVYHYRPVGNLLERLGSGNPRAWFHDAVLPDVQKVVSGVSMFICLTGVFQRLELKYGEGGYRSLAAEAGCIAENVVLAATALGLNAGPFSGLFDDLVNQRLGLDSDKEAFLIGVAVGHSDGEK